MRETAVAEERWSIPDSWAWAPAGLIADVVGGGTPSANDTSNFSDRGIAWITPADLTGFKKTYISRGSRDLSPKGYASSSARLLPSGSVLFSSRAPIGYCVIASDQVATNQGFKSFVLKSNVQPEFLRHYLRASIGYAESLASGTTFKELSGSRAAEMAVPIAPLVEQRRIVAKIDSLSVRSARARMHLDQVRRLVTRFKQSVLDTVFEKISSDPQTLESESFGSSIISTFYGPRFSKEDYVQHGVPTIRTTDFRNNGEIDIQEAPRVAVEAADLQKWGLIDGDILVTRTGSIGKCAVYNRIIGTALPSAYLIRVRVNQEKLLPKFAFWRLCSSGGQAHLGMKTTAVTQPNINADAIRSVPMPVCTISQQAEVIARIESNFSWIDRLAAEATSARKLIEHLNQAVLSKAFRGELVPQDPDDEPASVLLERIKAGRTGVASARRGRGRPRLAAAT